MRKKIYFAGTASDGGMEKEQGKLIGGFKSDWNIVLEKWPTWLKEIKSFMTELCQFQRLVDTDLRNEIAYLNSVNGIQVGNESHLQVVRRQNG